MSRVWTLATLRLRPAFVTNTLRLRGVTRNMSAMQQSNRLRTALLEGKKAFGAWQMIPGANVSRILARSGVDWVLVDCEHGNIDGKSSLTLLIPKNTDVFLRRCNARRCASHCSTRSLTYCEIA